MTVLRREQIDAGLDALERIKQGLEPTDADLEGAPLLDLWTAHGGSQGVVYLAGIVTGHPSIKDGFCTTSPLLFMPASRDWARTISRYYRLGQSIPDALAQSRATH